MMGYNLELYCCFIFCFVGNNTVTQFICRVWWLLRDSFLWGLNVCVWCDDKEWTDQIFGRIFVKDRRTGEGTDLMQDTWQKYGGREYEERRGPGVASGLLLAEYTPLNNKVINTHAASNIGETILIQEKYIFVDYQQWWGRLHLLLKIITSLSVAIFSCRSMSFLNSRVVRHSTY